MRQCAVSVASLTLLAVLAGACTDSGKPIVEEVTSLDVRGTVVDSSGGPVADAVVTVAWSPFACGGELLPGLPDTTDANGRFDVQLSAWGTFSMACVRLEAEPPPGGGLPSRVVQVDSVPLSPTNGPDTLEVQISLD